MWRLADLNKGIIEYVLDPRATGSSPTERMLEAMPRRHKRPRAPHDCHLGKVLMSPPRALQTQADGGKSRGSYVFSTLKAECAEKDAMRRGRRGWPVQQDGASRHPCPSNVGAHNMPRFVPNRINVCRAGVAGLAASLIVPRSGADAKGSVPQVNSPHTREAARSTECRRVAQPGKGPTGPGLAAAGRAAACHAGCSSAGPPCSRKQASRNASSRGRRGHCEGVGGPGQWG